MSWVRLIAAVRAVRTYESRRACREGAWRGRLVTTALLLGAVPVAGCTASSGATAHGTAAAASTVAPAGVVSDCLLAPASCYTEIVHTAAPDAALRVVLLPSNVPDSQRWIMPASGTGAAASLWGGLIALADQDAHHDLGFVNPAIYRIARGSRYHQAFHDITTGSNIVNMPYPAAGVAGYQAGPGWNPVTGWGTSDAQVLVPLLAA